MKQLLIIGARGFGREVYNLSLESLGYNKDFVVKGFLDDKADALEGKAGYPPIIDSVEHYEIGPDDVFICALGDVIYKKKYADIILDKGGRFINLIHREAVVGRNTVMGCGCIVCYHANISCDITMGNFNTFQPFVCIGHDTIIGNGCHFNTYAFVGGYGKVGDRVTLHTGAILLPKVTAEEGCIIGAGSVAIRRVKAHTTVFGNPAVRL